MKEAVDEDGDDDYCQLWRDPIRAGRGVVDRGGGCMRGCEKIQLLGEPSVLKILGSTFMEVIAIYLPGPRVCVQKKDMVASEKKAVCVQTKGVCVLKRRPCVYWKKRPCVLKRRTCVCVIPSLITGISPKDNFVCSHFFPSTDHLFLQWVQPPPTFLLGPKCC